MHALNFFGLGAFALIVIYVRLLVRVVGVRSVERKKHRHDSLLFRGPARWNRHRLKRLPAPSYLSARIGPLRCQTPGHTCISAQQLAKVGVLRGIGKRDARSRLEQLVAATKRARPKS